MSIDTPDLDVFNQFNQTIAKKSYREVLNKFQELSPRFPELLKNGFFAWVDVEDKDGHLGVYFYNNDESASSNITRMYINGSPVNMKIDVSYQINEDKIRVTIKQESNSRILTIHAFVNGKIVATQIDQLSEIEQSALLLAASLSEEKDSFEQSKTIDPSSLAYKALEDLMTSNFDADNTKVVFERMAKTSQKMEWYKDID